MPQAWQQTATVPGMQADLAAAQQELAAVKSELEAALAQLTAAKPGSADAHSAPAAATTTDLEGVRTELSRLQAALSKQQAELSESVGEQPDRKAELPAGQAEREGGKQGQQAGPLQHAVHSEEEVKPPQNAAKGTPHAEALQTEGQVGGSSPRFKLSQSQLDDLVGSLPHLEGGHAVATLVAELAEARQQVASMQEQQSFVLELQQQDERLSRWGMSVVC